MKAGDILHLNGIRAEYKLYGKKGFRGCIMPDGNYIVLSFEQGFVNLAWQEIDGDPSKKHLYKVEDTLVRETLPQSHVSTPRT